MKCAIVAFDFELERDLALRVFALRNAANHEFTEIGMHAGDPFDGLEDRIDGAVADGRVLNADWAGNCAPSQNHRELGYFPSGKLIRLGQYF